MGNSQGSPRADLENNEEQQQEEEAPAWGTILVNSEKLFFCRIQFI
jgi:hypothetical protein